MARFVLCHVLITALAQRVHPLLGLPHELVQGSGALAKTGGGGVQKQQSRAGASDSG